MGGIRRIGLIGLTGVGKSTAAQHLRDVYDFQIGSTGAMCRAVSRLLYGNEDKSNLIALTDALQSLDPTVFLKASLRNLSSEKSLVIDALRYIHDYEYAVAQAFYLVRITSPLHLRRKWLEERGQRFNFETDGKHASETQLSHVQVDVTVANDGTKEQLFAKIDELLNRNGPSSS